MAARPASRAARAAASIMCSAVVVGTSLLSGCLSRPIARQDTRTTGTVVERLAKRVDKIDLLLTIDNSASMKDKQDILALAVPDLVERLVNPRCIDPLDPLRTSTPTSPSEPCSNGMEREFEPVLDIHIGIISTSIGDHGSGSCPVNTHFSNNDRGRLVARSGKDDDDQADNDPPTYQGKGFLAWDPEQKLSPAGESILDDGAGRGLVPTLTNMVRGVADVGCGYESQLESWYRFLADPAPYDTIKVVDGKAVREGLDTTLLDQRKAFLRPDSLLAIVMLSDENDCSIREGGNSYLVAQRSYKDSNGETRPWRMFRPRKECSEKGPDDPCCKSCSSKRGECPVDETCGTENAVAVLDEEEDPINLRCFDQKRRFGVDLLYPIERYTEALTQPTIADHEGNVVNNPIFSDLDPDDELTAVRTPELVFFAGLVGVPWQDIARQNEAGLPDLKDGKDKDGNPVGGFKSAEELSAPNAGLSSTWDIILGDLKEFRPPADPHMIESPVPREGQNPITGTRIASPDSPDGANEINGHEWNPKADFGDLQFACTFRLREPTTGGDCKPDGADRNSPLCEDNADGTDSERQVMAKAYPGLRQLALVRDLGEQGIVGSVCPAQTEKSGPGDSDFGYRPAIGAIVDRLKTRLGGQCLPRALQPDTNGQVSCLVLEARSAPEGQCGCGERAARREVPSQHRMAKQMVLDDPVAEANGWNCVCEVEQLSDPDELEACQDTVPPAPVEAGGERVDGWCYVDPRLGLGREEVVAKCPSTERRQIRFTGEGEALDGATQFVICSGDTAKQ
ncbi:hypothetical protein [Sorangium cellulosum]|uniref:Uncharacterized protein n=1 Tax=Sorangium cellulosum TaxID=56 RepID=A0A150Q367_SORCE|nr:hypothetical protein [Sorangium cellulosum]KYF62253.1 hypothetical protein BE15_40010 [Sorangium cellulosum]